MRRHATILLWPASGQEPGTLLTAVAKTSKPVVYRRGWCQPHYPPQPPELALPQTLATLFTGGNLEQVENLDELTFPGGRPQGRDPWPMLMLLSAEFKTQKACMRFPWRACQTQIPGLHPLEVLMPYRWGSGQRFCI